MKAIYFFVLIVMISTKVFGQQTESLLINIVKSETKDSFYIYDVSVQNSSDSIACVLHSIFMNLTADTIHGVALYIKNKEKQEYSLHRAFEDTTYIAEAMPRKGEFILPHQSLNFKITILKSVSDAPQWLTVQYFYLEDMCYKDFKKEMKGKVGSWYYKYNRLKMAVKL